MLQIMKNIKLNSLVVIAMFLVALSTFAEDQQPMIDFANLAVDKVLLFYKQTSGCEMIESSDVKNQYHREISIRKSGSKEEILKSLEKVLAEQTGVVVTRLDDAKVSVTFNDALIIKPVKRSNPIIIR
jgi:hypothetical protein